MDHTHRPTPLPPHSHSHVIDGAISVSLQVPAPGSAIVNPLAAALDHPNPSAAVYELAAEAAAVAQRIAAGFETLEAMPKSARRVGNTHARIVELRPVAAALTISEVEADLARRWPGGAQMSDPEAALRAHGEQNQALDIAATAWPYVAWWALAGFLGLVLLMAWRTWS